MHTKNSMVLNPAMAKFGLLLGVAVMVAASVGVSHSSPSVPMTVDKWYKALEAGDSDLLAATLSEDAIVETQDMVSPKANSTHSVLGKAEFIASQSKAGLLAKHDETLGNSSSGPWVIHRQVSLVKDGEAVMLACYLPGNRGNSGSAEGELYRENFRFAEGVVTLNIREKLAADCAAMQ